MQWEYYTTTTLWDGDLKELGLEGWELVAILNQGHTVKYYFKRSLRL